MKFLKTVLILLSSGLIASAAIESAKPNILILYADDMGFGDLQIQNPNGKIPTPNLDRLATEGMRFTDAHSSSGVCTPSRYAMLTGRYHWRKFYGIVDAFGSSVFSDEELTMPEMLQANGYTTAIIGKWHLGWDWDSIRRPNAKKKSAPEAFDWSKPIPDGPLAHGFDYYFGDTVINFPPYTWIENEHVVDVPDIMMDTSNWKPIKEGNWECRPGPAYSGWDPYENIPVTTAKGVEYIKKQARSDQPFFLYFAFPSPHAPIIPNDAFDGMSGAGAYGDFVFETDDACGQLLQALEASGQLENTIVVFSADNGAEAYAYERDKVYGHWSSEPFRGVKQDIYEGGHHVPFIVRWPGVTHPGSVSDEIVSQIDLMATFANFLGTDLPDGQAEDSQNLLPVLKGTGPVRTSVVHSTWESSGFAIREGDWVLIDARNGYSRYPPESWSKRHGYAEDDDLPVELYNLKTDIGQRTNVAEQYPERVQSLQNLLHEIQN
jgi:arylsulfatase A